MCRIMCLGALVFALIAGAANAQQEVKQITFAAKHDRDPMVSPDGRYLAFSSDRTGPFNIFLYTFGQAGETQLTQSKKDDRYPNWAPDSKKVVFSSRRTGKGDIYVTDVTNQTGFLQLTDREDYEDFPSYHPQNKGLMFSVAPKKVMKLMPKWNIAVAEQDGGANAARMLGEGTHARFSPDGRKIVFVSERTKNKDIWVMNADGSMPTQLTTDPKDDQDPCFSPDGKEIVFASNRTGTFNIWVMNSDGSNQRQLSTDPADETQPCWSSGGYIYFVRDLSTTQSNIYQMKAPR